MLFATDRHIYRIDRYHLDVTKCTIKASSFAAYSELDLRIEVFRSVQSCHVFHE